MRNWKRRPLALSTFASAKSEDVVGIERAEQLCVAGGATVRFLRSIGTAARNQVSPLRDCASAGNG